MNTSIFCFYQSSNISLCGTVSENQVCIVETIIASSVTLCSFFSNLSTILAISFTTSLRTVHGYFLLSLAASDLVISLIAAGTVYTTLKDIWPYGGLSCVLFGSSIDAFFQLSFVVSVLLVLERYVAVVHPFRASCLFNKTRTKLVLVFIWILTIFSYVLHELTSLPSKQLNFICFNPLKTDSHFEEYENEHRIFTIVKLCSILFLVFVVFYASIRILVQVKILDKKRRRLVGRQIPSQNSKLASYKAFNVTLIYILGFVVLRTPHTFVRVSLSLCGVVSRIASFLGWWMYVSCGIFNFVVYVLSNETFRKALIPKCFRK